METIAGPLCSVALKSLQIHLHFYLKGLAVIWCKEKLLIRWILVALFPWGHFVWRSTERRNLYVGGLEWLLECLFYLWLSRQAAESLHVPKRLSAGETDSLSVSAATAPPCCNDPSHLLVPIRRLVLSPSPCTCTPVPHQVNILLTPLCYLFFSLSIPYCLCFLIPFSAQPLSSHLSPEVAQAIIVSLWNRCYLKVRLHLSNNLL